jgi:hypothetical protein
VLEQDEESAAAEERSAAKEAGKSAHMITWSRPVLSLAASSSALGTQPRSPREPRAQAIKLRIRENDAAQVLLAHLTMTALGSAYTQSP